MERYANNAGTTLNGAINSFQTSFTVTSNAGFPSTGSFRIRVGVEFMTVTSVVGNNFTVTRGDEGSANVAHSSGDAVNHTLTAGGIYGLISTGPIANRPPANQTSNGAIFIAQDLPLLYRHNGTDWQPYGPIYRMTRPPSGNWTLNNGNGSNGSTNATTFTDGSFSFTDVNTTQSGRLRSYTQPTPNRPYNITAFVIPNIFLGLPAGFAPGVGMVLRSSTTDRAYSFAWSSPGGGSDAVLTTLAAGNFTTSNTTAPQPPSSIVPRTFSQPLTGMFLRINETATVRRFLVSHDGVVFLEIFRQNAANTTFAADQIGVGVITNAPTPTTSHLAGVTVLSWEVKP